MGALATFARIALVVGAAFAAFAQPADAQFSSAPPLALELEPHEGRIRPITDVVSIPWTVTYSCDALRTTPSRPAVIEVRALPAEPWLLAEVSPAHLAVTTDLQACPLGETRSGTGDLFVKLTREAPAYRETTILVHARASVDGDEHEAENSTTVVADFYSIISASADRSVVNVGPGDEAVLPLSIENFGNGDVLVRLTVDGPTGEFGLVYPNETELATPYGDGNRTSAVINVGLRAPGTGFYTNDHATFDFRLTAFSAREPDVEGDHADLSVRVVVRGALGGDDRALPAVGFAWLVLPLAALLRRR